MDLEEAMELLRPAKRHELRDHAFGDVELHWELDGKIIAEGYFGGTGGQISVLNEDGTDRHIFRDEAADTLRMCGTQGKIERNDSAGPDIYVEGTIMAGLRPEDVRRELFDDL